MASNKSTLPTHDGVAEKSPVFDGLLGFFFAPTTSHTLEIIRIATGLMIVYVHAIWLSRLGDFFGPYALINLEAWRSIHYAGETPDAKWTYLAQTDSLWIASIHEWGALIAGVFATVGFLTRTSIFAAWLLTLLTAHRMTGFLFGLDQVVLMLSSYLCLSQAGSLLSLDRCLSTKFPTLTSQSWYGLLSGFSSVRPTIGGATGPANECVASWNNTLSTRLMQIHLCIIYLFGGLGKLRGEMWWDGSAMWYSASAYEYQSLDLTWIGNYPVIAALLTHITIFWEVTYIAIVWPRWTRPIAIVLAVLVHAGIAIFLGMMTFGWIMIVANLAFITPDLMRRIYPSAPH
ncbi:MAG: HTTM domain-containing protein [Pirellula sp.]